MTLTFLILSILLVASALGGMSFKNLIHCALSLAVSFATFGFLFMYQGAEFVGLIQILVYVGAVAVLIVFAILLVKGNKFGEMAAFIRSWKVGVLTPICLFIAISVCVLSSNMPQGVRTYQKLETSVIGKELMTGYVLPLEVVGLLLTTALIGGVLLASKKDKRLLEIHNKGQKNE